LVLSIVQHEKKEVLITSSFTLRRSSACNSYDSGACSRCSYSSGGDDDGGGSDDGNDDGGGSSDDGGGGSSDGKSEQTHYSQQADLSQKASPQLP